VKLWQLLRVCLLLLAVTAALLRPPAAVAGAVGVFGFLTGLAAQRGVDDQNKRAQRALHLQQLLPQGRVDVGLLPPPPRQKTTDLRAVPRFAPHRAARLQARHPAGMHQERDDHTHHQPSCRGPRQHLPHPPLETGQRFDDHDHGEAPSSAGEKPMIWSL